MSEYPYLNIRTAGDLLNNGEINCIELAQSYLNRISEVENRIRAFITVTEDVALTQAEHAQSIRKITGEDTRLAGIPFQIKDIISTKDILTTCASRMLETFRPSYSATATERLFSLGSVLLGKGNMDEFGMGSSTENSAFYPTRNPWDLTRVPGGSSGGPAAAVASGEVIYALGSDTGGSIRQPASLCGVVGMKPTYGLVSRYGLVAYASSLDQIGPITTDVTDCALVLNAIVGHDHMDSTSLHYDPPDYTVALTGEIEGIRIGVPKEFFVEGIDPEVKNIVDKAIVSLEKMGASIGEVSLPSTEYALTCYYIIAPSECSANLARYDGVKYGKSYRDTDSLWESIEKTRQFGFGDEVKRRIMLGTFALSSGYYEAYYVKAQKIRSLIRQEFDDAFKKFDVLVTPTSPTTAFPIGEKIYDPVNMYLSDIYTVPVNVAGLPAISIPCGFSQGLPVGMQLIGPALSEKNLLRVSYAYEQTQPWHTYHPKL